MTNGSDLERVVADLQRFRQSRYFGKYRGLVKEVDGTNGRIKAQVPAVFGDQTSPWAMPAAPFAGPSHGLVMLPEVDDGVWIEFEAGDPDVPIWTGFWWGDDEWPSPADKDVRGFITSQGLQIILDDKNKELILKHPGGGEIKMTDNDITITIGSASIKLSSSGINMNNGAFEVK